MHQQIRTSPGHTRENMRSVLDILARAGVNVEGIGPDFEPPHIRIAVPHEHWDAAWDALRHAKLQPEARPALTVALPNDPGKLNAKVEELARAGYGLESVLVLASRDGDLTLVSLGVHEDVPPDWEETAAGLGGWEDPDGWQGGDVSTGS